MGSTIIIVLFFMLSGALSAFGQGAAAKASAVTPTKNSALLKAESDLKKATDDLAQMAAERDKLASENAAIAESLKTRETDIGRLMTEKDQLDRMAGFEGGLLSILDREIHNFPLTDQEKGLIGLFMTSPETYRSAFVVAADIEKNVNERVAEIAKLNADFAALTERYNNLLSIAKSNQDQSELLIRSLSAQLNYQVQQNALAQQLRMANALAIYSLLPKYSAPQTINMNVTLSDCTKLPVLCIGR